MATEEKILAQQNTCDLCGRNYPTKRLTLKGLLTEFIDTTFSLDKGFLLTAWHLIIKPMQPINMFISGRRKPYTAPAKFLVVSITLYVIGYLFMPIEDLTLLKMNSEKKELVDSFYQYFQRYLNLGLFGLIPLLSLFTWAMSYKQFNYAENLVANAYIHAIYNIITILLTLVGFSLLKVNIVFGSSLSILGFVVLARNYFTFFTGKTYVRVFKTIGALFFSTLMMGIFALILVLILVYLGNFEEGTAVELTN